MPLERRRELNEFHHLQCQGTVWSPISMDFYSFATLRSGSPFQDYEGTMWLAKLGKGMLFSIEQAFVEWDEIRARPKRAAWETSQLLAKSPRKLTRPRSYSFLKWRIYTVRLILKCSSIRLCYFVRMELELLKVQWEEKWPQQKREDPIAGLI